MNSSTRAAEICAAFEQGRQAQRQGKSIQAGRSSDPERTIAFERGWRFEKERRSGAARIAGAR